HAPSSSLCPGHHEIDRPAAACAADKPRVPIRNGHLGAVPLCHLRGVRFYSMPAIEVPDDQPHPSRSGISERHRPPGVAPQHGLG
ncbi:MAG TPA: hypothetical protein VGJ20_41460, partial [Xanthobacteraceae bacterium]